MNNLKQVLDALENKFEEVEIDDVTHMAIPIEEYHELIQTISRMIETPAPTEKPIVSIKFHSKGDGFIRLQNEFGHLFDVTVPTEKVEQIEGLEEVVTIQEIPIIAPCGDEITIKEQDGNRTYWHKGKMVWNPKEFHRVGLMTIMLQEDKLRYEEKSRSPIGDKNDG